ncbi:F-box domain-containing protein [Mycena sanguinolenta]|uniref:F-box domain-containing protein n=1 Tax=Mycena sanguinolenta TaxID=230812 RepID=A0A8H7DE65_9AGAR|nr:F-box domain-containing protein [Mycena sanguinolenta]
MDVSSNYGIEAVPETPDISVLPGTRHHTLLTTNEPPEDSDTVFIQSIVSKCDARLAYLEDEISKSPDRREELEEERLSLLAYRAQNRAILSPIRRIPPEILGDIFCWTLPPILDDSNLVGSSPWLSTHISSRWRTISIAMPALWSRIVVDYTQIHERARSRGRFSSSEYHLSLMATRIQRSQKLKIHFYGSLEMDSRPQIQIFEFLMQHSPRWEELSVGLTTEIFSLLNSLHGRLPSLKRLWVQWDGMETPSDKSLDCFHAASSLVEFGVVNEFRDLPIRLPAPQLTRYELNGPWTTHERILLGAENLVEACIDIRPNLEMQSDSIIELRHLRRLYVSTPLILSVLKAHALEELAVFMDPYARPVFLDHLRGFVDRSSCPLRRVCLRGPPDAHTTTQLLKSFPSFTEFVLIITVPDEVDLIISALRLTTESIVVAPQLRSIFLGFENDNTFDCTAYLAMLKARWEASDCSLTHAALTTYGNPPLDGLTSSGLLALGREGLDLVLSENDRDSTIIQNAWMYGSSWNQ